MIRWLLYVLLVIAAVFVLFRILTLISKHRNRPSAREIADAIERHISGQEGPFDWDHFTSIPIADQRLNNIVRRCVDLDMLLPEHRNPQLRKIVEQLRNEPQG